MGLVGTKVPWWQSKTFPVEQSSDDVEFVPNGIDGKLLRLNLRFLASAATLFVLAGSVATIASTWLPWVAVLAPTGKFESRDAHQLVGTAVFGQVGFVIGACVVVSALVVIALIFARRQNPIATIGGLAWFGCAALFMAIPDQVRILVWNRHARFHELSFGFGTAIYYLGLALIALGGFAFFMMGTLYGRLWMGRKKVDIRSGAKTDRL